MKPHSECKTDFIAWMRMQTPSVDAYTAAAPGHKCDWWQQQTCMHGITFYAHPTVWQMEEWAREGKA